SALRRRRRRRARILFRELLVKRLLPVGADDEVADVVEDLLGFARTEIERMDDEARLFFTAEGRPFDEEDDVRPAGEQPLVVALGEWQGEDALIDAGEVNPGWGDRLGPGRLVLLLRPLVGGGALVLALVAGGELVGALLLFVALRRERRLEILPEHHNVPGARGRDPE